MANKIKLIPYSDPRTYFFPRRAIEETLYYLKERADDITSTSIKQLTEILNAAILALGSSIQDGDERWIRNPLKGENTPDACVMSIELRNNDHNRIIKEHEVEIVTMEDHAEDDVVEFLKRTKLNSKKSYPANSSILCRIDRNIFIDSWKDIHTQLMPYMGDLQVHFLCRVHESPTTFQIIYMGQTEDLFKIGEKFELIEAMRLDAKDLIQFQMRTGLDMTVTEIPHIPMFIEAS